MYTYKGYGFFVLVISILVLITSTIRYKYYSENLGFGTYNEFSFNVLVISILILITSTVLITSCTYNELEIGGLVNGTNTYNETPVYLLLKAHLHDIYAYNFCISVYFGSTYLHKLTKPT